MRLGEYDLHEHPGLRFEATAELRERAPPVLRLVLHALGEPGPRAAWREAVRAWADEHAVTLHELPSAAARLRGSSSYAFEARGWTTVVAALLRWLGAPWLERAAGGAEWMDQVFGRELRGAVGRVDALVARVDDVIERVRERDARLAAALADLSACLGPAPGSDGAAPAGNDRVSRSDGGASFNAREATP